MNRSTSTGTIDLQSDRVESDATRARLGYLDGIRGWASLVVLQWHLVACFLALSTPELKLSKERLAADIASNDYLDIALGIFLRIVSDGKLAVMVFFVLSGYALSVNHLNLSRRNLALATAARYFRLMIPILFTSLIAYALLKAGLFFNTAAATTPENSSGWLGTFYRFDADLKNVLMFASYDVFFRYDEDTTYNSSLWTMPIELAGSVLIYAYLGIFRTTEAIYWKVALLATAALAMVGPPYACFMVGYLIAELNGKIRDRPRSIDAASSRRREAVLISAFAGALVSSAYFRDNRITFFLF